MKKRFLTVVCICSMLLLGGCGLIFQMVDSSQRNEIRSLEVWGVTDEDIPGGTLADLIEQEEGNCHLYEKMGYRRSDKTEQINEKMTLVFYEK